jgi:anhydro-N-acetylmuramic acid kinase
MISGTSYDGIDCAIGEFHIQDGVISLRPLFTSTTSYSPYLYNLINSSMPPDLIDFQRVCELDTLVGEAFATAAVEALTKAKLRADVVVSHGQTMYHWISEEGRALGTLQLGDGARIAEKTGVTTITQLRSRDVAAGGQGAPFASLLDDFLLRDRKTVCAALNLGGISNMTVVSPLAPTIAFDIGPANALIDAAVRIYTENRENFDLDGKYGAQGVIDEELLQSLLGEPYYAMKFPKSTGKELFNKDYLIAKLAQFPRVSLLNVISTLTALTARTISVEINALSVETIYVSGGGIHNLTLMEMLKELSPDTSFLPYEELGINADGKEAYLFALIGFLSMHNLTGNIPSSTGARGPRVLGSIWPGALGFPEIASTNVSAPSLKII